MNASRKTLFDIEKNLFFVVGCGRSGTTLLHSLLNANSMIHLPRETFFFNNIANGFGDFEGALESKLNRLMSKWWICDMNVTRQELRDCLGDDQPSWRNLFLALLMATAKQDDSVCFGEKTVGHIRYAQQLLVEYSKCRIIQIVRDPRAAYSSFRSASVGSNQISALIRDWQFATDVDHQLHDNPRYLKIKFEDLIRDTPATLQRVCDHLGVPYQVAMLDFHKRKDIGFSPEQKHHENTTRPIFSSSIDQWKSKLSSTQTGLIEHYLGERMTANGYSLTGTKVAFPKARMAFSQLYELLEKTLFRRPQQLLKRLRARKRQSASE